MNVIIASNNKNKIREFKKIFEDTSFSMKSLSDMNIDIDIEETGKTFEENALIKAKTISKKYNVIAISDDSGLTCEGLNGEPGVYSARYAGDMHDDKLNNEKLMKKMKNVKNRHASYVCAICMYFPDDKYLMSKASCDGIIIDTPKGNNGFGYDPYFYIDIYQRTMAEISLEEKNNISHRAKALNKLKELYNENFNSK